MRDLFRDTPRPPRWVLAIAVATVLAVAHSDAAVSRVYRVAMTDDNVEDLVVAGGRVFWSTWGSSDASVFSSFPAGNRRRLLRVDAEPYDEVYPALLASASRVAVQVEAYTAGIDEDYHGTIARASGAVSASRMAPLEDAELGYERLLDVDGDRVLTLADKLVRGRRILQAYVRDIAARTPVPHMIGRRVTLAPGASAADVETRIGGRHVAMLRSGRITVFDLYSNRTTWTVRLPSSATASQSLQHDGWLRWDLAPDGTIALARTLRDSGPMSRRYELGWVPPHGHYRRLTGRVAVRAPFTLRDGIITYVRPHNRKTFRLVERPLGRPPRAITGDLPTASLVASDRDVVAVVLPGSGPTKCVLAALRPITTSERWSC